jgi:hypothetical protein
VIEDLSLDADTQELVGRYVEAIRDYVAADEQWVQETGRYTRPTPLEVSAIQNLWRGPTGPGTSAARLSGRRQPLPGTTR